MQCAQCGAEVKDEALFCNHCGTRLGAQPEDAAAEADPGSTTPLVAVVDDAPDQATHAPGPDALSQPGAGENVPQPGAGENVPQPKKNTNRAKVIAISLVAVAVIASGAGAGLWWKADQDAKAAAAAAQAEYEHAHTSIVTKIEAEAPGFDDAATAIPVQVVGTDLDGNAVNEVQFMRPGAMSVTTLQGSYDLTFPGGYFTGSGQAMKAPGSTQHFDPMVDEPQDEADQPALEKVAYTEVSALEADEGVISDIVSWAQQDPEDHGKASELGSVATTAHDDAVAAEEQRKREEEERRAAEEAARAARHYSSSCVELDLPANWVGEVKGDTMDHTSGMYHVDFTYGDMRDSGHNFMIFRVDGVHGNESNHGVPQGSASWANLGQIVWQSRHASSKSSYRFSDSELEHIIDLMTGGSLGLSAFDGATSESACTSIAKPVVDDYMNSTIVPTIKYK